MVTQNSVSTAFISTGIPGLDNILGGGLTKERLYLLEGDPGSGKTTMALQFLIEGAKQGETVLYITLAENNVELRAVADAHGFSMEGVHVHEVIPEESLLDPGEQYTVLHPSEVELGETNELILGMIEKLDPSRVVLDSLSELQLLSGNALRYRRHVLALKQYFSRRACTALLLDDKTAVRGDQQVRSIAHGVISLEHIDSEYGAERRIVRVMKYRGIAFRRGPHDYSIVRGGIVVYPRIVAAESRSLAPRSRLSSGIPEFDALLGGGIEEGSSTLISGPPGTGKSSLAVQFIKAVTNRGSMLRCFFLKSRSIRYLTAVAVSVWIFAALINPAYSPYIKLILRKCRPGNSHMLCVAQPIQGRR